MSRGCDLLYVYGIWPRLREQFPRCCDSVFNHRYTLGSLADVVDALADRLCPSSTSENQQLALLLGLGKADPTLRQQAETLRDWADVLRDGPLQLATICGEGESPVQLMHSELTNLQAFTLVNEDLDTPRNGQIDLGAYAYLKDLLEHSAERYGTLVVPLTVRGNGNCMLNALSWAIWGSEAHAVRLRQDFIDEIRQHASWYKQERVFGNQYATMLEHLEEYDPYAEGANASLSPMVLSAAANVLARPVVLCDSLARMHDLQIADPWVFGTFLPTRLLAEGQPLRTAKPVSIAWSGEMHTHFVALVAVAGFADMQLPFFAAEELAEDPCLCAGPKQEPYLSWAAPSLSLKQMGWYGSFENMFSQARLLMLNLEGIYPFGVVPRSEVDRVWCNLVALTGMGDEPLAGEDEDPLPAGRAAAPIGVVERALRPEFALASLQEYRSWCGALYRIEQMLEQRRRLELNKKEIPLHTRKRERLRVPGAPNPTEAAEAALEAMGWVRRPSKLALGEAALCPTTLFGPDQDTMLRAFLREIDCLLGAGGGGEAPKVPEKWRPSMDALRSALASAGPPGPKEEQEQRRSALSDLSRIVGDWLACLTQGGWGIVRLEGEQRARLRVPGVRRPQEAALEVLCAAGWGVRSRGGCEELFPQPLAWGEPEAGLLELITALRELRQGAEVQLPPRHPRFLRSYVRGGACNGEVLQWDLVIKCSIRLGVKVHNFDAEWNSQDPSWFQRMSLRFVTEHLPPHQLQDASWQHSVEKLLRELCERKCERLRAMREAQAPPAPVAPPAPLPAPATGQEEEDEEDEELQMALNMSLQGPPKLETKLVRTSTAGSRCSPDSPQHSEHSTRLHPDDPVHHSAPGDFFSGVAAPEATPPPLSLRRAHSDEPSAVFRPPPRVPAALRRTCSDRPSAALDRSFAALSARLDKLRMEPRAPLEPLPEGTANEAQETPSASQAKETPLASEARETPSESAAASPMPRPTPKCRLSYRVRSSCGVTVIVEAAPDDSVAAFLECVEAELKKAVPATLSAEGLQLSYRDMQTGRTVQLHNENPTMPIADIVPDRSALTVSLIGALAPTVPGLPPIPVHARQPPVAPPNSARGSVTTFADLRAAAPGVPSSAQVLKELDALAARQQPGKYPTTLADLRASEQPPEPLPLDARRSATLADLKPTLPGGVPQQQQVFKELEVFAGQLRPGEQAEFWQRLLEHGTELLGELQARARLLPRGVESLNFVQLQDLLRREVAVRLAERQRQLYSENCYMQTPNPQQSERAREAIQQQVLVQAFKEAKGSFQLKQHLVRIAEDWGVEVRGGGDARATTEEALWRALLRRGSRGASPPPDLGHNDAPSDNDWNLGP